MNDRAPGYAKHKDHSISISMATHHVMVKYQGIPIASSSRAVRLAESHYPPRYYFPKDDVAVAHLKPSKQTTHCPFKGNATFWDVGIDYFLTDNAAWTYEKPFEECKEIEGFIAFNGHGITIEFGE